MRPKSTPPAGGKRILVRGGAVKPAELAAANQVVDAWQATVWTKPLPDRQEALLGLLEVLDG